MCTFLSGQVRYSVRAMSYAIETKKRKFHRVLESFSKPLSTEPAKKPEDGAIMRSSSGRPRSADPTGLKKARLMSATTTRTTGGLGDAITAQEAVVRVGKAPNNSSSASSTIRPSFVPWDRERFLERLETFRRVDWWSSKPAPINEVAWAKRGWICTGVMRVTCVGGCGGAVVVKLPDELDELDGYDMEKVQERKHVRMCSVSWVWFLSICY